MKKLFTIIAFLCMVAIASVTHGQPLGPGGIYGGGGGTGNVTSTSDAQTWGGGTGPVVWTFSVTGTDPTISVATGAFTFNTDLALGANDITMTGSLGATGARVTKGWFTDLEVTNAIAGSTTGNIANTLLDATGSMVYASGANTPAKLAAGTAGYVLKMGASIPEWSNSLSVTIDDSAAQFVGVTTDHTGKAKIDLTTSTPTKTTTLKLANADDATITFPTATSTLAILGANTFTGAEDFSSATVRLPTGNADPTAAAGWIRHDSTVTNHANGAVRWHDGTNIRQMVDLVAATAEGCTNAYVIAYDSTNDLFYCKEDATAGAPTMDTIGDAAADGTIALAGYETTFTSTLDEANHSVITIYNNDADRANDTTLLTLKDDDAADANAFFIKMIADADGTPATVFSVTGLATTIASTDVSITGTQFRLPSTDADPTATAGYIRHDSTNTSASGGGLLAWHDGTNIRQVVDTGATFTQITKYEYLPIRYAEDDVSVAAPAAAAEIGTTSLIGRSFAEDADNGVIFFWQIPSDYVSGIKYRVFYALNANGQADETAAFSLAGCSVGNSDALACSEGTAVVVSDELGTDEDTGELIVTGWSTAVTITDAAAGEMASLLLIRDVSEDDYSDHLLVAGIEIKYVSKLAPFSDY